MIFTFLNLPQTNHIQGERAPTPEDPRPTVVCTFVTEFEDHIFVTVDAEAFFFLHDLISSYVKEKERVISTQTGGQASHTPPAGIGVHTTNQGCGWIRIRLDPHSFSLLDPDPHSI